MAAKCRSLARGREGGREEGRGGAGSDVDGTVSILWVGLRNLIAIGFDCCWI